MADSTLVDLTAETAPDGGDIVYLVADPFGTPVDRKVTVANLAAADSFADTYAAVTFSTWTHLAYQTLTDKTSWAGTGNEQWGSEEVTCDNALLPKTTGVTVRARVEGSILNDTSNGAVTIWVDISLDGGSSWNSGLQNGFAAKVANVSSRIAAFATHQITGTVTGDIQARGMGQQATGAGASYDLMNGALTLDVIVSP